MMKIADNPKLLADLDHHGHILIWLFCMLKVMKTTQILHFLPLTSAFLKINHSTKRIHVSESIRFVLAIYYQSLQQFQFTQVLCFMQQFDHDCTYGLVSIIFMFNFGQWQQQWEILANQAFEHKPSVSGVYHCTMREALTITCITNLHLCDPIDNNSE